MFGKKTKTVVSNDSVSAAEQDLIVHNMPKTASLSSVYSVGEKSSGFSINNSLPASQGSITNPRKNNFKIIGLLIMIIGFLVIGILVYFSYRFIIAPSVNNNTAATVENVDVASEPTVNDVGLSVPEISGEKLSSASVADIDVATTSETIASSTVTTADSPLDTTFLDSDNDGLNDNEEAVLGTNPLLSDSDSDAYPDLAELSSQYNPGGAGKIDSNGNLAVYNNPDFKYSILYPKNWTPQSVNEGSTVIFSALDSSLIQVSVQDNPDNIGILNWYGENFPEASVSYNQIKTSGTWDGVMGNDGLNYYVTDKAHQKIFIISYIPAIEDRIAYPQIFQLIVASLMLK